MEKRLFIIQPILSLFPMLMTIIANCDCPTKCRWVFHRSRSLKTTVSVLKHGTCAGLSHSNLTHPPIQFRVPCRWGQQVHPKFYIHLPNYRASHLKRQRSPTSVSLLFVLLAMIYRVCILPVHTKHSFSQWSFCMRVSCFVSDLYSGCPTS